MFGLDGMVLAFIALAGASAGAIAYAFLFNSMANEKNVGKRLETVKRADSDRSVVKASRDRVAEAAKRRKSVQDSLKDLEEKNKVKNVNLKKPPLKVQIRQAGIQVDIRRFYIYSAVCGAILTAVALVLGAPLIVLPGVFRGCGGRPAALVHRVPARAPGQGVSQRIPQCAGRDRARRQIRPSAQ